MRYTTVVSLLVASWAVLSQSPAAYAAPVPNNVVSAAGKRQCSMGECKIATTPDTDTTSQSGVQSLVNVLISALQTYQAQNAPSNFNSTADFAVPEDTGPEPEPVVDAMELADAGV
ncbi:hypothetical protein BJV77DRAFT_250724 [Russula vinacea]|nr:hypothetical protein BJV77DRAFT_250724 [Russula vinacea]